MARSPFLGYGRSGCFQMQARTPHHKGVGWRTIVLRRFVRIFFLFAAGVSLLLCVAAAGMWVWSYAAPAWVSRWDGADQLDVVGSRGELQMLLVHDVPAGTSTRPAWMLRPPAGWELRAIAPDDLLGFFSREAPPAPQPVGGFLFRHWALLRGQRQTLVIVPLWLIVTLTGVPPFSAGVSIRRRRAERRRLSAGHCPRCGYDCRATPGRCSECGGDFAVENAGIGA
jgi:hypothetical protein